MSWPKVKLGDVATVNPRAPKELNADQIVSFVGMASVTEDGYLQSEEPRVLEDTKKGFTYFAKTDVLLAKITPCFENGKCLRSNQISNPVGFGSTEFHVLRPDESRLDATYLFYMIWSNQFRALGAASMSGAAGQKRVGSDFLKNFEIPLPPLAEQKRIAAILDKADAIRRKRQQAIQLADDFLSAEFLRRFGDHINSPFGSKFLKEVTLKITDGAHFTPTYVSSGVPFLRVTDITKETVDWTQVKYIPQEEHQELIKRCKPEKGDVLYSKNGTIGVPKFIDWDNEFSIFVSLCLLKPDPRFLRGRFLYSFLKTPFALKQATQKAKSATVTNLHLIEIKEIKMPVPPLGVQDEWLEFVSKFGSLKERMVSALNRTNEAFGSLSQKAFSGQL